MDSKHQKPGDRFNTTHWSIVVSARVDSKHDSQIRRASLEELCSIYWMPLFVYLRRKNISPEDAADFVQGFLSELVEKDFVKSVEQDKGRFRWFLMSAINRFIAKQIEKKKTQKRGGQHAILSIDLKSAEQRYQNEPVDGWTAEKIFDRRWALTVLQQTLEGLEAEYADSDKANLFEKLRPLLMADSGKPETYSQISGELGMTEGAVKVAASRMRDRYRKRLSEVVCQTIADEDCLDDELNVLLSALRGPT